MANILIVEDEPKVSEFVKQALREAGYDSRVASNLSDAEAALKGENFDVVLLDLMLPDGNGLDLLGRMKAYTNASVLVLTAKTGLKDRVAGLDLGADDYLGKPFRLEELLARVRALLRRHAGQPAVIHCDDLEINLSSRKVSRGGKVVYLSNTEYGILEHLAKHLGQNVPKSSILEAVWDDKTRDPNVVEVYIRFLRNKLERGGARRLIYTVRGRGYCLSHEPFSE